MRVAFIVLLMFSLQSPPGLAIKCHCTKGVYCHTNECEINSTASHCLVQMYTHDDGYTTFEQKCVEYKDHPISENRLESFLCNPDSDFHACVDNVYQGLGRICFCCRSEYCNTREFYNESLDNITESTRGPTSTEPTASPSQDYSPDATTIATISVGSVILIIIVVLAIALTVQFYSKGKIVSFKNKEVDLVEEERNHGMMDGTITGSGVGMPILTQRSIAQEINLVQQIGRGRYGQVWRGEYRSEEVAVKIFEAHEQSSWSKEVNIYATCLLQHPNILRFIGADTKDMHFCTQRWLVFECCDQKSLYEYLQNHTLTISTFLNMVAGVVCGVEHLHEEVHGQVTKPAIAHRDLKSGNILVRADGSCCIADLGLALRSTNLSEIINDPSSAIVGTKRYLAPEILAGIINFNIFQSFLCADVYSLSLIIWEMATRVMDEDSFKALEYQIPYQNSVPHDPSLENMKEVVVTQMIRPLIPQHFRANTTLNAVANIMEDAWQEASTARPSALLMKKKFLALQFGQEKN